MCLHRKWLFICVAFVHSVSICSIVIRVSFGVLQLFLLPSLHNTPLVMRVRNIYVSDHRHIAANAYKRLYILSPCFQLKTRLLQEHPKTKVTHTEWNPEIMWKYSFSFNFKSQIRLFKERGVHFSSCFVWLTSWLNVLLQFRKNSPFVFVNVLTTNQTCFRNWFDFNRRKNTEKEYCEQLKNTDICAKVDVIWIKSRFFGIVTELCMQSFVGNRVLFIR